ncbi:protein-methionine-sulfoxide reductase catalytic subunit MsrP [Geitlerinema sp. P-1104]|uniref:protein-methionine-sulfoxide reductase catalytic subunit MsrP n=1 Tax=Geitlerinema sp. P-1104 TaxID=2546230 RepID=UPI00336BD91A
MFPVPYSLLPNVFIHIPKPWTLPASDVTSETVFWNRRRFLKSAIAASVGVSTLGLSGCRSSSNSDLDSLAGTRSLKPLSRNPQFTAAELGDRTITPRRLTAEYNNFYEFGGNKSIWKAAQALPTDSWKVEVGGLVKNPQTYDLDDLKRKFPIEERIYRFRCVEAWSMVVPWAGFPMRLLLEDVDPLSNAKFVRFTSYYDSEVVPGPGWRPNSLPWPYREGLTIEEMANDLAFFATGAYGETLPKQNGAPIRMVIPWKYGFKGAKSIVKIDFVEEQPATYWNSLIPNEYGFVANVNPDKPHPRWSQAQERLVSRGPSFSWETVPTLPYNGYGEFVAHLYG